MGARHDCSRADSCTPISQPPSKGLIGKGFAHRLPLAPRIADPMGPVEGAAAKYQ